MENQVRRDGPPYGQAVAGHGEGGCEVKESGGGPGVGYPDYQGGGTPKLVSPERRRRTVREVRRRLGHERVSERRTCKALKQVRSTQRYHPTRMELDLQLLQTMRRITEDRPRFGCERVHPMLSKSGWSVGFGRVHKASQKATFTGPQRQQLRASSRNPPQSRVDL